MDAVKEKLLSFPVTEFEVEALIDSQLTWEEEKMVRQEMDRNPSLRAYHDQLVHQKKLLVAWFLNEFTEKSAGGAH